MVRGFGRVGIVSTAELISAWLTIRRSGGLEFANSQAGAKFVSA